MWHAFRQCRYLGSDPAHRHRQWVQSDCGPCVMLGHSYSLSIRRRWLHWVRRRWLRGDNISCEPPVTTAIIHWWFVWWCCWLSGDNIRETIIVVLSKTIGGRGTVVFRFGTTSQALTAQPPHTVGSETAGRVACPTWTGAVTATSRTILACKFAVTRTWRISTNCKKTSA